MEAHDISREDKWASVVNILPADLGQSARQTGALERCRKVPNAVALMRLILAYALSDFSLNDVAAWAAGLGIMEMTGPAFFYRLRSSEKWLQHVLGQLLCEGTGVQYQGLKLRIVDATVITGPAATGTDWRVHAMMNPETGGFESVELTDVRGGESYSRCQIQSGDIVLGDRAYGRAPGIDRTVSQGRHVVARLCPQTIRVCDLKKRKINLLSYEDQIPKKRARGFNVLIPVPPDKTTKNRTWDLAKAKAWIPVRVVGARTIKGTVIWVLTTLKAEQISEAVVLKLYRLRWQVELLFKRLKSQLHIDALPTRDGPTARSWILARLLAAAIAQKMVQPSIPFFPRNGPPRRESQLHAQPVVEISHDSLGSSGSRAVHRGLVCYQR